MVRKRVVHLEVLPGEFCGFCLFRGLLWWLLWWGVNFVGLVTLEGAIEEVAKVPTATTTRCEFVEAG